MTKNELVQKLADSVDIPKTKVDDLLKNLGVAVSATLKDGGEIALPGVGKIVAVKRAARTARNPFTGETVNVPAKTTAKLKVSRELATSLAA